MPKIAYLQCPTGIAGDMVLGALVDLGVPLEYLIERLEGLNLSDEYSLRAEKVKRQGIAATQVHVYLNHRLSHQHRHLPQIQALIGSASLPPQVKTWSLGIFEQLAIAEGKVHGVAPEKVHFHEVGATDAIVDIVGSCLGFNYLEVKSIYCSSLPVGGGTVRTAHGALPVPVPAVLAMWQTRQVPVYSNGIEKELVTPTGAAIVTTLAQEFGPPPQMQIEKIGSGAGTQELPLPNLLRLWLGNQSEARFISEEIAVLQTQIDDLNPQIIGFVGEELWAAGALDVFTQPLGMKKNRPGILLTVICPLERISTCEEIIFRETTTLGIREQIQTRAILPREIETVGTEYGKVRVKVATIQGKIVNIQPEYEDCAALARKHKVAFSVIYQQALYHFQLNGAEQSRTAVQTGY